MFGHCCCCCFWWRTGGAFWWYFLYSAVLSLYALRLSYDHLQSPRSHNDSHIVHTIITHSTEEVIVRGKLCALFDSYSNYWQFRLTGISWFPLVTPDEFRWYMEVCSFLLSNLCQIIRDSFTSHSTLYALPYMCRDSVLLGVWRSGDRIPVGPRFSAPVRAGPGANPTSYTVGTGSLSRGVKWPGRGVIRPPTSCTEVKEMLEPYFSSPSGPMWPVLGFADP
jgi:hypothetical protein